MKVQTPHNIKHSFTLAAPGYDALTSLHRQVADELLGVIKEHKPSSLLDVGCGTGYLTVKAQEHLPESKVIGLDFAQGMLDVARCKDDRITWILADGHHMPFEEGVFDAVVSNLAYQWSMDLPQAFREVRRVLNPRGFFACTLFGYQTCQELFEVLSLAGAGAVHFNRLSTEPQVRLALGGFSNVQVKTQIHQAAFNGMQDLMAWLKAIGANSLGKEGFLGPKAMRRAQDLYREKFPYNQGVKVTFEIIRVYAKS